MDAATRDRNIATWLGDAPQPVRDTTDQLLERIALLRAEQTIYPAQDDILNALAFTPADQVKVIILGQDPYHGPNQAMGLSFSVPATQTKLPPSLRNIYKELNADLGCPIPATGDLTPWAQQASCFSTRRSPCASMPRTHTPSWAGARSPTTLSNAAVSCPSRSSFWHGAALPSRWLRQARRDWHGQDNRQVLPCLHAPLAAFGQPCHGRTPRFYGVASLLGSQSATRTARLDHRQLDLPRLKIDTSKNAPDGTIGRVSYSGQINCVRPASPPSMSRLCPVINRLVTPTK